MATDPRVRWWLSWRDAGCAAIWLHAEERGSFRRGYVYSVSMPLDRQRATLRRVLRATLDEAVRRVLAIDRPAPFPGPRYDPVEAVRRD